MLIVTPRIRIPEWEISLTYVRSSGPGGQNVNKVNSKAVLRWNLRHSPSLDEVMRARLLAKLASRLTREGELLISSDVYREQGRNREDCLEKLRALLFEASQVPKIRRCTQPTKGSQRRRREAKSHHGQKKKMRSGRLDD